MILSIIAAIGNNRVLGKDNGMLWHLPKDLEFFMNKTMGHYMLMGKKTYLSLSKMLKGRKIIVLSRDKNLQIEGCIVAQTIEQGVNIARENGETELFIGGGEQIYTQMLDSADKMYLTHVDCNLEGDAYFPEYDLNDWKVNSEKQFRKDERHAFDFNIIEYTRNTNKNH